MPTFFPAGLLVYCPSSFQGNTTTGLTLLLGWLLYTGLTIAGLLQKPRVRFIAVYGTLCLLLMFNVAGCKVQMKEPIM